MTRALPDTARVSARAKINVFLRVLGIREDGYHEVETLVVPIDLADRLQIHAHADPTQFRTLSLSLEVLVAPHQIGGVPMDESNLVLRAASSLAAAVGARGFADITLEKQVPAAAGLGGGSADAAATLRALNELWNCDLDDAALAEVGQAVGSDVPALLAGGAALARGRGERVEPVTGVPSLEVALVAFPFGVSTAQAFRWWDEDGGPTGPDPGPALVAWLGGSATSLADLAHNDLEEVVIRRRPEVGKAKERLLDAGAQAVVMCGSGPTLAVYHPEGARFEAPEGLEILWVRTEGNT